MDDQSVAAVPALAGAASAVVMTDPAVAPDRAAITPARWIIRHRTVVSLLAILIVAAGLRIYDLAGNPPGLFCDEASRIYDAYSVLHTGADRWGERFPFYFRSLGDYVGPVFIYLTIPFAGVLGLNALAGRLLAALLGIGTVALLYPLGMALFRRRDVALLSAAVLAVAPWHILFSRVAFETVSMPFFQVLAATATLAGLRRRSTRLYIAGFVLWGVSLHTYQVARLLTPLLLGTLLLIYHRDVWAWRRYTAAGLAIFAVMTTPMVVALVSGTLTARLAVVGVFSHGYGARDLITIMAQQYVQHFSVLFLFSFGSRPGDLVLRNYIPGLGALYWAQLPLVLVGLAALAARRDRAALTVIVWLLLYPLGGTLTEGASQERDLFGVVPFSLITAYGIAECWFWLRRPSSRERLFRTSAGLSIALVVLVVSLSQLWNQLYVQYPRTTAGYWGWQGGPAAIIGYFKQVENRYDALYMTGSFNAPEIFLPFYAHDDCARCTIGGLEQYNPHLRQLFALRPEEMALGFHYSVKRTLYYGDGTVAFKIVTVRQ